MLQVPCLGGRHSAITLPPLCVLQWKGEIIAVLGRLEEVLQFSDV